MGAAKHLLRYLVGTTDFTIVYKKGGFKLTAFLDSNWGNNPDNSKSTSWYIMMLSRAPVLQVGSSESDSDVHDGG